jgi:hypothetical protein
MLNPASRLPKWCYLESRQGQTVSPCYREVVDHMQFWVCLSSYQPSPCTVVHRRKSLDQGVNCPRQCGCAVLLKSDGLDSPFHCSSLPQCTHVNNTTNRPNGPETVTTSEFIPWRAHRARLRSLKVALSHNDPPGPGHL